MLSKFFRFQDYPPCHEMKDIAAHEAAQMGAAKCVIRTATNAELLEEMRNPTTHRIALQEGTRAELLARVFESLLRK